MEIGAARRHYNCPLTRTMHIGKPPKEIAHLVEVIVEAGDTALAAAKPGNTCEEVEAVWQSVLNRNGYPAKERYHPGPKPQNLNDETRQAPPQMRRRENTKRQN